MKKYLKLSIIFIAYLLYFYFFSFYLLIQFDCIAIEEMILPTQRLWHNSFIILKIIMMFALLIDLRIKSKLL